MEESVEKVEESVGKEENPKAKTLREAKKQARERRKIEKFEKKQAKKEKRRKSKIRRVIVGTIKGVSVTITVLGMMLGMYIYTEVKPLLVESKRIAYEKLASVDKNTFRLMENTEVYGVNGEKIGEVKANNYEYIGINEVSKYIQEGYIAVEDRMFLTHNGVDLKALTRAGIALLKNSGEITQGGSTITQQVIKNTLLTQEQTFKRKLIELLLAPEIERMYSKAEIMEFYVNTNYYGNGCYGIESASKFYFGKSAKNLTLGEAAVLVGVSNNPSKYNPVKYPENVKKKREFVLTKMLEVGVITEQEYKVANEEEINLVLDKKLSDGKESYLMSYALHSTVIKVMELDGFKFKYGITDEEEYEKYMEEYKEEYSEKSNLVRSGGFKIETSLDPTKQEILQKAIDKELEGFKGKDEVSGKYEYQGAGVIVNNETGYVEAIVGGRGTEDTYNRGFLAVRQPGSAIKPLVAYGVAFDSGEYYPSYVMEDKYIDKGPKNAYTGYRGNMSLREAIKISTNTIPYRLLLDMGTEKGLSYLGKMRFDTLTPTDNVGSLALGGVTKGVRVVDMAKGFSTIANGGVYIDNTCITKLSYGGDGVIYNGEELKKTKVYEEDTAYMLVDVLRGVLQEGGTGYKYNLGGVDSFGKTGTTSNNKDNYFVGATPEYTLAVWTGYDMPKTIESIKEGYAGQIWKEVMLKILKDKERQFERPSTIIESKVDSLGNMSTNGIESDLFSQIFIARQEEKKEKAEKERMVEVERQWREADKERQEELENLLTEYETSMISSVDDLERLDKMYREIEGGLSLITDNSKKEEFENRLKIKREVLDLERGVWETLAEQERLLDLEEEKKRAEEEELARLEGVNKAKEKLIEKGREAIRVLRDLDSRDVRKYYYYTQAEDIVSKCYGYEEQSELIKALEVEKKRLGIEKIEVEVPKKEEEKEEDVIVIPPSTPQERPVDDANVGTTPPTNNPEGSEGEGEQEGNTQTATPPTQEGEVQQPTAPPQEEGVVE